MAAHYGTPFMVVMGTTLGMLIADIPAVLPVKIGDQNSDETRSLDCCRGFALLGVATLLGAGSKLGF